MDVNRLAKGITDQATSEFLGSVTGPDGKSYSMHFYGEQERAAVITGPTPHGVGRLTAVPEVCRVPAKTAEEARQRLAEWMGESGW